MAPKSPGSLFRCATGSHRVVSSSGVTQGDAVTSWRHCPPFAAGCHSWAPARSISRLMARIIGSTSSANRATATALKARPCSSAPDRDLAVVVTASDANDAPTRRSIRGFSISSAFVYAVRKLAPESDVTPPPHPVNAMADINRAITARRVDIIVSAPRPKGWNELHSIRGGDHARRPRRSWSGHAPRAA